MISFSLSIGKVTFPGVIDNWNNRQPIIHLKTLPPASLHIFLEIKQINHENSKILCLWFNIAFEDYVVQIETSYKESSNMNSPQTDMENMGA